MNMYLCVHLTCIHSRVCTWFFSIPTWVIILFVLFSILSSWEGDTKDVAIITFPLSVNFGDGLTTVSLKYSINFCEESWTFFCIYLWSWWRGETISDLLLNFDLESLLFLLIHGNETSVWITLNQISEFCSVSRIFSNNSSLMKKYSRPVEVLSRWYGQPIKAYQYPFTKLMSSSSIEYLFSKQK